MGIHHEAMSYLKQEFNSELKAYWFNRDIHVSKNNSISQALTSG